MKKCHCGNSPDFKCGREPICYVCAVIAAGDDDTWAELDGNRIAIEGRDDLLREVLARVERDAFRAGFAARSLEKGGGRRRSGGMGPGQEAMGV